MTTLHAPAPWKYAYGEVSDYDDQQVALLPLRNETEADINGHLIAAAPDLLDALEKARLVLDSWLFSNNDPVWINELVKVTRGALTFTDAAIAKAKE